MMTRPNDLYESKCELTDVELDTVAGGGEVQCNGKGDCKFVPNGADVWNAFAFANGSGIYIK